MLNHHFHFKSYCTTFFNFITLYNKKIGVYVYNTSLYRHCFEKDTVDVNLLPCHMICILWKLVEIANDF